jgi:dTDP-4-dehydrorhamnose 3,5-epimerase
MKFVKQSIPDVLLIEPTSFVDERGSFMESFRQDIFDSAVGHHINFVQDNESKSIKGVLRGLHYQLPPFSQSKLVRVLDGEVLDVAVDIRSTSPTYGKHVAVILSSSNKKQLFIPKGFAHGFIVLSDNAVFSYKVDNYYSSKNDRGIFANDLMLNIDWILPVEDQLMSKKDMLLPNFSSTLAPL